MFQQNSNTAPLKWDQSQISSIATVQNLDALARCQWDPIMWANAYKSSQGNQAAIRNLLVLAGKYTQQYLRDRQSVMQSAGFGGGSETIAPLPQSTVQHSGYLPPREVARHPKEPVTGMTIQSSVTARVSATDIVFVNGDALDVAEQLIQRGAAQNIVVVNTWDPAHPGESQEGQEGMIMLRTELSTILSSYKTPLPDRMCLYACDVAVLRGSAENGLPFLNHSNSNSSKVWRVDIASIADRDPPLSTVGGVGIGAQVFRMRVKLEMVLRAALERGRRVVVLPLLGAAGAAVRDAALVLDGVLQSFAGCIERVYVAASSAYYSWDTVGGCAQVVATDVSSEPWKARERDIFKYGSHSYPAPRPPMPYTCLDVGATPCNHWQNCTNTSPDHRSIYAHPPPCPGGDTCAQTGDATHLVLYSHKHPCRDGAVCPLAIAAVDNGASVTPYSQQSAAAAVAAANGHLMLFSHPKACKKWAACTETDAAHIAGFLHPPTCPRGPTCSERKDPQHASTFRHIVPVCPAGGTCPLYADPAHTTAFLHPFRTPCTLGPLCPTGGSDGCAHLCTGGPACPHAKDPRHAEEWIHAGKVCPRGATCRNISEEHLGAYFHPAWNGAPWRPLCNDRWCNNYSESHRRAKAHYPWYIALSPVLMLNVIDPMDAGNGGKRDRFCFPIMENGRDWAAKIDAYTKGGISTNTANYKKIKSWFETMQPNHMCSAKTFLSIVNLGNYTSLALLKDFWIKKNDLIEAVMQGPYTRDLLRRHHITDPEAVDSVRKYGRKYLRKRQGEISRDKIASYKGNANATSALNYTKLLPEAKVTAQREARTSLVGSTSEDFVADFEKHIDKILADVLTLIANPPGIGNSSNITVRTNYTVFTIVGPHYGSYDGAEVVMVLKREIMHHPDFYMCPVSVLNYQDGDFKNGRPWVRSTAMGPRGYCEELDREKIARFTPGWADAATKEWIARVNVTTGKSYNSVNIEDIETIWAKQGPWSAIEGHLPYRVPLEYTDHVIMCTQAYRDISSDPTGKIILREWKSLYGNDFVKVVSGPDDVKVETEKYHLDQELPKTGVPQGLCFSLEKSAYEKVLPMYLPTGDSTAHFWLTFTAMGPFYLTLSTDCDASCSPRSTLSLGFRFPQAYAFPLAPMAFVQSKALATCPHFNAMFAQKDFVQYAVEVNYSAGTLTAFHWGPASALNAAKLVVSLKGNASSTMYKFLSFAGSEDVYTFPIIWDLRFQTSAPECILSSDALALPAPAAPPPQAVNLLQPPPLSPLPPPPPPPRSHQPGQRALPFCDRPFDCPAANHSSHIRQYMHVCIFGNNCRFLNDPKHTSMFCHMKKDKCPDGSSCTKLTDPAHRFKYSHPVIQDIITPCRYGDNCRVINNDAHCRTYYHGNSFQFPDISSVEMLD